MTADFIRESIARTNEFFGGLNPQIYRAFLTHGEMDPRRHLGPSADLNLQSPVVVMSRRFCIFVKIKNQTVFFFQFNLSAATLDPQTKRTMLCCTKQKPEPES